MNSTHSYSYRASISRAVGTVMLAVLLLSVLPGLAQAQDQVPTPGGDVIKPLDIGPVPSMTYDSSAGAGASFASTSPQIAAGAPIYWSKLVYQNYLNQNWEIYTANIEGGNQVNLTNSPAADARPRLNTRALQIAFNSDRGGNQDIYIMNPDGSGVSQVTHSKFADYAPAWSPDNTRLAFVSERDKNPEIYSIDLASRVETRLTSDPAVDATPAWSPDGAHIAWVRYADTTGTLWIANPDGGSPQAVYTAPFLQHPVWSPSGSRIGFDADLDGDGWNELGAIHPDGSGIETLYDMGAALNDLWMGNWSNDEDWIFYTAAHYTGDAHGHLYVYNTAVDKKQLGQSPYIVVETIFDQFPDLKLTDIDAPASKILSLEPYSRAAHFFVDWQGSDTGPSGIDTYDIQARTGAAGSWADWITNTKTTAAIFSGSGGDTLYFRSRAEDNAGNVEAWPGASGGDATTTLFTWLFSGLTQDNRGFRVPNANLNLSPAALSPLSSDKTGSFFGRLTASGLHTLQTSQAGYGAVDPAHPNINVDFNFNTVFPPQDNLVLNGGFEASGSLLTGWTITGSLPAAPTHDVAHTGNYAATLGVDCPEPCLGDAEAVPGGASFFAEPRIALDSQDNVHTISISNTRVLYNYRSSGGVWSMQDIGGSSNDSPDIVVDGLGNVHAAWNAGSNKIVYANKPNGGTWSAPIELGDGLFPRLAVDHENNVYLLFGGNANSEVHKRTAAGVWQPAIILGETYAYHEGDIIVGPDDVVHMVWSGFAGLFYRSLSPAGVLSEVYTLTPDEYAVYTKIDVDSQGNLFVCWTARLQSGDAARYRIRSLSGAWSFEEEIPGISYLSDAKFDRIDRLHILGGSTTNTNDCLYAIFDPKSGWYGPVAWETNAMCSPAIAFDHINRMHAVTPIVDLYPALRYQSTALADSSSQVSIQQALTIPAATHQATLSWLYRVDRLSPETPSLTVSISTGDTATRVFSSTAQIGWAHAWADVSAWAGQTVTVTFTLHQAAGEPLPKLYLDEVTLGSWLTPVVTGVTPATLAAWDATDVITITGLNFMDTPAIQLNGIPVTDLQWVDEHTVRIHLPAGLPVGAYDVVAINPGGQVGILPSGLRLGQFVFLPVTQK